MALYYLTSMKPYIWHYIISLLPNGSILSRFYQTLDGIILSRFYQTLDGIILSRFYQTLDGIILSCFYQMAVYYLASTKP